MFPYLLLNAHNLGLKVRLASSNVTSNIEIESVDISEGRTRNHAAEKEEGRTQAFDQNISKWPQYFERNEAENSIKSILTELGVLEAIRNFWRLYVRN